MRMLRAVLLASMSVVCVCKLKNGGRGRGEGLLRRSGAGEEKGGKDISIRSQVQHSDSEDKGRDFLTLIAKEIRWSGQKGIPVCVLGEDIADFSGEAQDHRTLEFGGSGGLECLRKIRWGS